MGTPDFALSSLEALMKAGYQIAGVVTSPDKPAGRGMKVQESAVKKFAMRHQLKIIQPLKLKDPGFLDSLRTLDAQLQVVVAFRMLPEQVWNMPPMGTINLHGSLLPQYRGAAPINWAIINGEKETGVTTFKMKQEIDTGDILLQEKISIGDDETAGELHDRMKIIGASLVVRTVQGLADGTLREKPQDLLADHFLLKPAPKIITETCRIDWDQPVETIHNLIRGLSPYPSAFSSLSGKMLKIFRSIKEIVEHGELPGTAKSDGKTFLKFACTNGYILVRELQLEGKKKMKVEEFLRGYRLQ